MSISTNDLIESIISATNSAYKHGMEAAGCQPKTSLEEAAFDMFEALKYAHAALQSFMKNLNMLPEGALGETLKKIENVIRKAEGSKTESEVAS